MNKVEEQLKVIPDINLGSSNASTHAEQVYTTYTDTYMQDMHTQHTQYAYTAHMGTCMHTQHTQT